MDDWSHGYDVSAGYTYGFYREMAPDWLDLCARIAGHVPRRRDASTGFRYLELGAGQGLGLCLLAAANPQGEFLGVDFHPGHIAHAESIADAAGLTNIRFREADFADLGNPWPAEFGTFDYVALHGIYSWVPPAIREALIRCLSQATRPGSLVYNSYNAQPGWLSTMPFQHITRALKEASGDSGGAVFDASITLFDRLRSGNASIFQILPGLKARLDAVKNRNSSYLVQEYLHESWNPLWHSEVGKEFGPAKLDYLGSATIAETMLPDVLPPPLRDAIVQQRGAALRQDLQDFVVNQSFRRDIFCRGALRSFAADVDVPENSHLHLLSSPATGSTIRVDTSFGEISLQYPAFAEIVDALAAGPKSVEQLVALPSMRRQDAKSAVRIVLLLLHANLLAVGPAESSTPEAAQRLNAVIAQGVSNGAPYGHIAVPTLGSAIPMTDIDLMLIDSWLKASGQIDAVALASGVSDRLAGLNRAFQHEGKTLEGADARQRLMALARVFLDRSLPKWRQLGALP